MVNVKVLSVILVVALFFGVVLLSGCESVCDQCAGQALGALKKTGQSGTALKAAEKNVDSFGRIQSLSASKQVCEPNSVTKDCTAQNQPIISTCSADGKNKDVVTNSPCPERCFHGDCITEMDYKRQAGCIVDLPEQLCSDGRDNDCDKTTDCGDADCRNNPTPEICNGLDDNCNGNIDEGFDSDGDGFTSCAGDCNDTVNSIKPGVPEICDGVDNNCVGGIDEGVKTTYYLDSDHDNYGNTSIAVQACSSPAPASDYVTVGNDCNDATRNVNPGHPEGTTCNAIDDNCDGTIDNGISGCCSPGNTQVCGNTAGPLPCKKGTSTCNANGNWGSCVGSVDPITETCNSVDDNCDNTIDNILSGGTLYYKDGDGDGKGLASDSKRACSTPSGYVTNSQDCDDTKASCTTDCTSQKYPDTDTDGFGAGAGVRGCDAPTGYVSSNNDCAGTVASCTTDCVSLKYPDTDADGYGSTTGGVRGCDAPAGHLVDHTDCNDAVASIKPGAAETCNGIDDDCDSTIDDGVKTTFYRDADSDGYGTPATTQQACTAPSGYVSNSNDCKDSSASVNPAATEDNWATCSGAYGWIRSGTLSHYGSGTPVDEDCDGYADCNDCGCCGGLTYPADATDQMGRVSSYAGDAVCATCPTNGRTCLTIAYRESTVGAVGTYATRVP